MKRAWSIPMVWVVSMTLACAASHVTSSWKDPTAETKRFQKVLVVTLVPEETMRRSLEQELAARLGKAGVEAAPSSQYFQTGQDLTKEAVKDLVDERGFDSVLVTQYLGTQREVQYVPGSYNDYLGYMGSVVYSPGYVRELRTIKIESRLFDAGGDRRMLWSASTDTVNPGASSKEIPVLADKIVEQLQKDVHI